MQLWHLASNPRRMTRSEPFSGTATKCVACTINFRKTLGKNLPLIQIQKCELFAKLSRTEQQCDPILNPAGSPTSPRRRALLRTETQVNRKLQTTDSLLPDTRLGKTHKTKARDQIDLTKRPYLQPLRQGQRAVFAALNVMVV